MVNHTKVPHVSGVNSPMVKLWDLVCVICWIGCSLSLVLSCERDDLIGWCIGEGETVVGCGVLEAFDKCKHILVWNRYNITFEHALFSQYYSV